MLILYIQHLLCSLVQVYIIFYAYNKTLILYCILIEGLYYTVLLLLLLLLLLLFNLYRDLYLN